jgi:hypothetical protein
MVFWRDVVDMCWWQGAKWGWTELVPRIRCQARVSGQDATRKKAILFSFRRSNCPALMSDSLRCCQPCWTHVSG